MIRKGTSILLLLLMAFMTMGYQFIFYFQLNEIKSQMRKAIQTGKLDYSLAGIQYKEEGPSISWLSDDEFSEEGKVYDVIEKHPYGKKVLISCVQDIRESDFVCSFQKNFNNGNDNEHLPSLALLKLMNAGFIATLPIHFSSSLTANEQVAINNYYPLPSTHLFVICPPPWSNSL